MTTKKNPKTREFVMEIDLRHQPDVVWQALSDPVELVRWFPTEASVNPNVSGEYHLDWDMEDCAFHTRIAIWEPPHRLRLVYDHEGSLDGAGLAMDFSIDAHAVGSSLRLVHSGFGRDSDWDDEFQGISRGWAFELANLQYYLDNFRGQDRHMNMLSQVSKLSPRDTFNRLFGPLGFGGDQHIHGIPVGGDYQLSGEASYRGRIFCSNPPFDWAGTVHGDVEGMLRYHLEPNQTIALALATWGESGSVARDFAEYWQMRLQQLFG